jgi:hypothetical protein
MTGWILILFAHVGPMAEGNSNALSTAQFANERACIAAGEAAKQLARGTVKSISYACKPQS